MRPLHPIIWLACAVTCIHAFYHYVPKTEVQALDHVAVDEDVSKIKIKGRDAPNKPLDGPLVHAGTLETLPLDQPGVEARDDVADDHHTSCESTFGWWLGGVKSCKVASRAARLITHLNVRDEPPLQKPAASRTQPRSEALQARAPVASNVYPIVSATPPTQPTSLPVDQDGTDYSYFSTVKFGSSGKQLRMLLDTGGASTWVMSSECTTEPCRLHTTFGKADSTTMASIAGTWRVRYATGEVGGTVVRDTVSLAGINLNVSFGLASQVSDDFLTYPVDGILGLARPRPNEMNVPSMLEALKTQGQLKANVFGVSFQRHADRTNDGEITFGDWNRAKMQGELTWLDTVNETGSWEIAVDDAGLGGRTLDFAGKTAIIDTGTSFILMPPEDAKKLHALLPGVKEDGERFRIPCASTANMTFVFGGVSFTVSPLDYVGEPIIDSLCYSNVIGRDIIGANRWLMGDVFLKNVYTVFDWDQNRIGFAKKAATPQNNSTINASSTERNSSQSSVSESISSSSSSASSPSTASTTNSRGSSTATPTASGDPLLSSTSPSPRPSANEGAVALTVCYTLTALTGFGVTMLSLLF